MNRDEEKLWEALDGLLNAMSARVQQLTVLAWITTPLLLGLLVREILR